MNPAFWIIIVALTVFAWVIMEPFFREIGELWKSFWERLSDDSDDIAGDDPGTERNQIDGGGSRS